MPVFQLNKTITFPSPELAENDGLLALGGDLLPARLIAAYKKGIFPWFSDGDPILWWFTSPRLVIFLNEFRFPRRLQREINKGLFKITTDQDFQQVIENCATINRDGQNGTWITKGMQEAYCRLHEEGYAHSIECWQNEQLVGGLYGIALDRVFFGESMFSKASNASKIALTALVELLVQRNFKLLDCQMTSTHLLQFGAREMSGSRFSEELGRLIKTTAPDGAWSNDNTA